ncbi:hypothetical protein [Halalkalibacter sp. APA_J-10(15)]|uniref:hypothetical protein n=1 Tax=Halalkalibacter sp. APA_J-10(15) TaxID=2933805 RepID=UPI00279567ED|nr:hypothetical protein [Halalkalibacter sp. APA_J-10(15)]
MSIEQHIELLEVHPGPVILSGYAHPLYDETLSNWRRERKKAKAEGGAKREEVLWINPVAVENGIFQECLF